MKKSEVVVFHLNRLIDAIGNLSPEHQTIITNAFWDRAAYEFPQESALIALLGELRDAVLDVSKRYDSL